MGKRKKASKVLRQMSKDILSDPTPTKDDVKTAKYLNAMANKNDRGTLTEKEAISICEGTLGYANYSNLVICSFEGGYWVEID